MAVPENLTGRDRRHDRRIEGLLLDVGEDKASSAHSEIEMPRRDAMAVISLYRSSVMVTEMFMPHLPQSARELRHQGSART